MKNVLNLLEKQLKEYRDALSIAEAKEKGEWPEFYRCVYKPVIEEFETAIKIIKKHEISNQN